MEYYQDADVDDDGSKLFTVVYRKKLSFLWEFSKFIMRTKGIFGMN